MNSTNHSIIVISSIYFSFNFFFINYFISIIMHKNMVDTTAVVAS